jgi:hypothetical protein
MATKATFALKAGVWFRRIRFVIFSPDRRQSSPLSGKNSTYRPVQILPAISLRAPSVAGVRGQRITGSLREPERNKDESPEQNTGHHANG